MPKKNSYRCPKCGRVVKRASEKAWIPSYCSHTGNMTRIIRQEPIDLLDDTHHDFSKLK